MVQGEGRMTLPVYRFSAISKWHAFDAPKALSAALDFGKGKGTAKSITAAMKAAGPQGFAGKTRTALVRAYALAAKNSVAEVVAKLVGSTTTSPQQSVKDPQTGTVIDFLFTFPATGTSGPDQRIAVLVGPYTNKKLYIHRCAEWITKGLGWHGSTIACCSHSRTPT
jgi:hypothetical protein